MAHLTIKASPASTSRTPTSRANQQCFLLDRLPAELRNTIYETAFCTPTEKTVDLLRARSPSPNILLTCRQIYDEARLVHKDACRRFWSETVFEISIDDVDKAKKNTIVNLLAGEPVDRTLCVERGWVDKLREADVACISTLYVEHAFRAREKAGKLRYAFTNGLWAFVDSEGNRSSIELLLLPRKKVQEIENAGCRGVYRKVTKSRSAVSRTHLLINSWQWESLSGEDRKALKDLKLSGNEGLTKVEVLEFLRRVTRKTLTD